MGGAAEEQRVNEVLALVVYLKVWKGWMYVKEGVMVFGMVCRVLLQRTRQLIDLLHAALPKHHRQSSTTDPFNRPHLR